MARLILHIGTHKTGTTSVQQVFATHRHALEPQGLIYPRIGQAHGHHGLVADWVCLPPAFRLAEGSARAWKAMAAKYAVGDHTVLLSSEEFARGHPGMRPDLNAIRAWTSAFDEVRIVCVLRDQLSFLQSVYLELAKKQPPPYWAEFLQSALRTGYAAGLHLDYSELDKRFCTVFGEKNVRYIDYGAVGEIGIINEILLAAGMDQSSSPVAANNVRANVSPEPLVAWVASMIARPEAASPELLSVVERAMQVSRKTSFRSTLFTKDEEQRLCDKADLWNTGLRKRMSHRQKDLDLIFPPFKHEIRRRDTLDTTFWIRLARALRTSIEIPQSSLVG